MRSPVVGGVAHRPGLVEGWVQKVSLFLGQSKSEIAEQSSGLLCSPSAAR